MSTVSRGWQLIGNTSQGLHKWHFPPKKSSVFSLQISSVELKVIVRKLFIYSIMIVQLTLRGKTYEVFEHVLLIHRSILYTICIIYGIFACYIICNRIKLNKDMLLRMITFITGYTGIWIWMCSRGSRFVETYMYALAIQRRIAIKLARPISHHMQKAVKRTIIFIKYWFRFSQSLDEGGVRFA